MCNSKLFFCPTPWGSGERSKGQISVNLNYKVNFKDLYTKLCVVLTNERYKTYQTEFSFCRLGHAPGVRLWGAGGTPGTEGVKKIFFFKHGHVEYQIDGDDEQNRMQVKFSSYGQTGDLGVRSNIIKFRLSCQFHRFLYQSFVCVLTNKR